MTKRKIVIGDVYYFQFEGVGCEQSGIRSAVIIQNNKGNEFSPNLIVLPLTTKLKHIAQPTHVLLKSSTDGVPRDSMVLCENPVCVSKDRIKGFVTTIPNSSMKNIATAYLLATSVISFVDITLLEETRERAISLNK